MYSKGQAEMEMRTEKGLHVGGLCSVSSFSVHGSVVRSRQSYSLRVASFIRETFAIQQ